jgi:hypothetical protein
VVKLYSVEGIPQTFLLDGNLKIIAVGLRGAALEDRLKGLLGPGDEEAVAQKAKDLESMKVELLARMTKIVVPEFHNPSATTEALVDGARTAAKKLHLEFGGANPGSGGGGVGTMEFNLKTDSLGVILTAELSCFTPDGALVTVWSHTESVYKASTTSKPQNYPLLIRSGVTRFFSKFVASVQEARKKLKSK